MTVNSSEKFGVADSMAMDTGHGGRRPLLTEEDILRRQMTTPHSKPIEVTFSVLGWIVGLIVGGALLLYGAAWWFRWLPSQY